MTASARSSALAFAQTSSTSPPNEETQAGLTSTPRPIASKTPQASQTTPTLEVAADVIKGDFPLQAGQVHWYKIEWEYDGHLEEEGNWVYETSAYYVAEAIVGVEDQGGVPTFSMRDHFCQAVGQDLSTCDSSGAEIEYQIRDNSIWRNGVKFFEWPLEVGRTWRDDLAIWEIFDLIDISTEIGHFENCYEIQERTSHGWAAFVICPGIGVVEERAGGPSDSYIKRIVRTTMADQ